MKTAVAVVAWLVVSSSFGALFPTPLHLVRRIEDPIAQTTTTVEQYCAGDRIVAVNGSRITITDYAAQRLTEIDHARGTYSITSFSDIARARPAVPDAKIEVRVEVDRTVALSRDAVEALVGAAYPNRRAAEHDQILAASAPPPPTGRIAAQSESQAFGLPAHTEIAFDGITYRNDVVRVDHELAPPQLMLIDPGATRVESRLTRASRELHQLDAQSKQ